MMDEMPEKSDRVGRKKYKNLMTLALPDEFDVPSPQKVNKHAQVIELTSPEKFSAAYAKNSQDQNEDCKSNNQSHPA